MTALGRLNEINTRTAKAMPGTWTARYRTPWSEDDYRKRPAGVISDATAEAIMAVNPESQFGAPFAAGGILDDATAEFIAAARQDVPAMEQTLRELLVWAEKHKINSGLGYDCVQARDVAAIIERGLE